VGRRVGFADGGEKTGRRIETGTATLLLMLFQLLCHQFLILF
jgi:hypothetical protein